MAENCCANVAAFNLETGQIILQARGFSIRGISMTHPPGSFLGQGSLRIVRQEVFEDGTVELVVSYESYVKEVN